MPISLKLPVLDDNPILLAETRTNKIIEFVRDLPFSDPISAAADLVEELQILNSQKVAFSNRVNALEVYRPAAIQIHQALIPQFSNTSLPISKNEKSFAVAATNLWQEIAYGYKWALIDLQSKIINMSNEKSTALVIQRAIHALKEMAFISYLTYRTPSNWLWTELHQLYYSAAQQTAQKLIVEEGLADTNESSVNAVYTQALLLALANPHHLSSQDIVKTDAYLTRISADAELRGLGFVDAAAGVFLVDLNGEKPPIAFSKNKKVPDSETDILLLTVKLAKRIHTHLKLLREGVVPNDGSLPSNAIQDDYEELLGQLITHFGKSPLRAFSRSRKNDGLELGIGINDAHHFVQKIGDDFENLIVQSAAIKPSRWQVLNVGAGGYALRKFNSSKVSMLVGDIAAIKNNTNLTWELGVVRWANVTELNQLDAGLELISPSVKAIEIKSEKNADGKGLLLPEMSALKQPASIVVPRGEYATGEALILIQDGEESSVLVTKRVERTATFERYQYSLI